MNTHLCRMLDEPCCQAKGPATSASVLTPEIKSINILRRCRIRRRRPPRPDRNRNRREAESPKVIMLREAERTFGDDSGGPLDLGGKAQRRAEPDEPDQDERTQRPGVRPVSRRDDGHDDRPRDRSA